MSWKQNRRRSRFAQERQRLHQRTRRNQEPKRPDADPLKPADPAADGGNSFSGEQVKVWAELWVSQVFVQKNKPVRYIEVDLCVVVGLHRPHDLQPRLKPEKKQSPRDPVHRESCWLTRTYVVSIRFCRQRQSMCSSGGPLHPLRTHKARSH